MVSSPFLQALVIVEAYEATLEGAPENEYEHSEMLLYKVASVLQIPRAREMRPRP